MRVEDGVTAFSTSLSGEESGRDRALESLLIDVLRGLSGLAEVTKVDQAPWHKLFMKESLACSVRFLADVRELGQMGCTRLVDPPVSRS